MAEVTKKDLLNLLKQLIDMHGSFANSLPRLIKMMSKHSLDPDATEFLAAYRADASKGGQRKSKMTRGSRIVSGKY